MGWIGIIIVLFIIMTIVEYAFLFVPMVFITIIVTIIAGMAGQKKQKTELAERAKKLELLTKQIEKNGPPQVETTVILGSREKCYYQGAGFRCITSRRITKYQGKSAGASFRVAKGVTVRTGTSKGTPIRKDVTDRYPGNIAITNKRIIFLGSKGFEFTYGKMTAIDYYSNAIDIQVGSKAYVIASKDIDYITIVLKDILKNELGLIEN